MSIIKAYGYITREHDGIIQVLVFRHSILEAGIQIPKGTVKPQECTSHTVIREIQEETGLKDFKVEKLLAEDFWENDDGIIHNRFFYKIQVCETRDEWDYAPIGGGDEDGLLFHYFWISSQAEVELSRGHGDYLHLIFKEYI
ncbi:NUDIX domain-containing protein [Lysinibacillus sp. NPDC097195]|uniref:NUDIX hydrolase n=1 Tax=Lysinibacillus sp. NPDC097195 TaxID=3364141 RepID=UPI0037F4273E